MAETGEPVAIEEHRFAADGEVPNNPMLPLVLYRGALAPEPDPAAACIARFSSNGWTGAWRNGIYPHHHYHSTAHEVLGIVAGTARVRLGGPTGESLSLAAGDVVVIPAGVAHKCEEASRDLLVVGAYPSGQTPDLQRAGAPDRARPAVAAVPLPPKDPLTGADGPLVRRWRAAAAAYKQRPE